MWVDDVLYFFFFFKQKTAYEIYQCDWSSDVCSSDLICIDLTKDIEWQDESVLLDIIKILT